MGVVRAMILKNLLIMIICIIASIIVGGLGALYLIPYFSNVIYYWGNAELLTVITICGVLVALTVPFINAHLCKKNIQATALSTFQIDIQISTLQDDNMVIFSASIENLGDERIVPVVSNLYIDQGTPVDKGDGVFYEFPFIHEHKGVQNIGERPVCILTDMCCNKSDLSYPISAIAEKFKDNSLFKTNIELRHLGKDSLKYINTREKFTEDVAMQFKKSGVYRASLIVITELNCECSIKEFYIPKSL